MQKKQSNDSTGNTQESLEWINVMINRSSSIGPPIISQERGSHTPESDAQRLASTPTPTSPEYLGSPAREVADASRSWTDCHNNECRIHLGANHGSGWYPRFSRRSRKQSVAHDHDWRQVIEVNLGENWATQQEPHQRRARRDNGDITSWEHCFNDNCNKQWWEKVDAGYYPRQVGGKGTLSKNTRREERMRKAVRTQQGREGSEKQFQTWKLWKEKSRTSEA